MGGMETIPPWGSTENYSFALGVRMEKKADITKVCAFVCHGMGETGSFVRG